MSLLVPCALCPPQAGLAGMVTAVPVFHTSRTFRGCCDTSDTWSPSGSAPASSPSHPRPPTHSSVRSSCSPCPGRGRGQGAERIGSRARGFPSRCLFMSCCHCAPGCGDTPRPSHVRTLLALPTHPAVRSPDFCYLLIIKVLREVLCAGLRTWVGNLLSPSFPCGTHGQPQVVKHGEAVDAVGSARQSQPFPSTVQQSLRPGSGCVCLCLLAFLWRPDPAELLPRPTAEGPAPRAAALCCAAALPG